MGCTLWEKMWIFQNDSFVSVVAHRDLADSLLVRSRVAGDIERAVPGAETFEDANADYRYRAVVSREAFAAALAGAAVAIDYPNFKGSIPRSEGARSAAYHDVWGVLARAFGAFGR